MKREFFVRSEEQVFCPCCKGRLKVIGSRERKYVNAQGQKICLVIRRMRCADCKRIHHELPYLVFVNRKVDPRAREKVDHLR
ncbi:DUF6431 domain-containing protein [Syntrophothermus lipocalidus]|uniref:DUF6431 domain-containing protein n=1 Tax=Syntrophothermus lipocalidus TaxID=86170 RepID=UPI003BF78D55